MCMCYNVPGINIKGIIVLLDKILNWTFFFIEFPWIATMPDSLDQMHSCSAGCSMFRNGEDALNNIITRVHQRKKQETNVKQRCIGAIRWKWVRTGHSAFPITIFSCFFHRCRSSCHLTNHTSDFLFQNFSCFFPDHWWTFPIHCWIFPSHCWCHF